MDLNTLAELLFPDIQKTPADIFREYPPRQLPEGAKVTRFAPSPTGFVHFGGLFPTRVSERLAHQSGGCFYLRIEDTDAKREVEGAAENLIETLDYYGISFDEGVCVGGEKGVYGPYRQQARAEIYQVFAKDLVRHGLAYPCFCSEDALARIREEQEAQKADPGYYGKWAACRDAGLEETAERIAQHMPFVLRFRSDGDAGKKIKFTDLVRGAMELTENDKDHVLLKSDGIPTYHFAHAVDDTLMGTTHVVRGEEWLPSLPFHLQLFRALGFRPPKYLHIAQLMKLEGNAKKKLSKRDKGVDMNFYKEKGYAPECVNEYVMTLLNSNYEEWRAANPDKPYTEFPFSVKKMSVSGCLFDFDKLHDVCRNTVARMTAREVYEAVRNWAKEYDIPFFELLRRDPAYAEAVLQIGRGTAKPRKDIAIWSEVKAYMGLFYDELFAVEDKFPEQFGREDIRDALLRFADSYSAADDSAVWFDKIKAIAAELGYAPEMKLYKQNPENYKGNVADISMFLRIAVTGRKNSPDLYEVMKVLGAERVMRRIQAQADALSATA